MGSTKKSRGRSQSREPRAEENVDSSVTPRNLRSKSLQKTPATGRRNSLKPISTILMSESSPSTSNTEDSWNQESYMEIKAELAKMSERFSIILSLILKEQEQAQRKHEQHMMDFSSIILKEQEQAQRKHEQHMMDFRVKQQQMMDRLMENQREHRLTTLSMLSKAAN